MLNTKQTRTTVVLSEELLFEVKKKALTEKKTLKDVFFESLALYLYSDSETISDKKKETFDVMDLFGAWGKGKKGVETVKQLRYGKQETTRDAYLKKLWKKS